MKWVYSRLALPWNTQAQSLDLSIIDPALEALVAIPTRFLSNPDVIDRKNSHHINDRAKKRPAVKLTSIGVSKIALMCSLVITASHGPDTAMRPSFSSSA